MRRPPNVVSCKKCGTFYLEDHYWPLLTCPLCRTRDDDEIWHTVDVARTRKGGVLSPDLTFEQWKCTIVYFGGMCAYCQRKGYECLEHFVPMTLGGSTTATNVVPSCLSCNKFKSNVHPVLVTGISKEDIDRVRDYLLRFHEIHTCV